MKKYSKWLNINSTHIKQSQCLNELPLCKTHVNPHTLMYKTNGIRHQMQHNVQSFYFFNKSTLKQYP